MIYGAGQAGIKLASTLKSGNTYKVINFIDDSKNLEGMIINGIKIISPKI